jgi:hypothetical protein
MGRDDRAAMNGARRVTDGEASRARARARALRRPPLASPPSPAPSHPVGWDEAGLPIIEQPASFTQRVRRLLLG